MHSAAFLDLCDELGFYVYEEFTDKWHSGSYDRYYAREWQADVDAMITRDRNRPSVILWGAGNEVENQAQSSMLDTLHQLTDRIRMMDPTRPVSYAMNPHFKRRSGIDAARVADIQKFVDEADEYEIEDPYERVECISRIAQYVDVISCNYQEQWFDAIRAANPDKPILATEVYPFFLGHWENMQNFCLNDLPVAFGEKHPACCGSFIWAGYDYLGESQAWPNRGSTSAVFRSNGRPRMTAHILRALWTAEPMVRLGIMDYSLRDELTKEHWSIPPYEEIWDFPQIRKQVVPYLIATNCEEVILSYGEKRLFLYPDPHGPSGYLTGFVPYVPGEITATGLMGGRPVCSHTLRTPEAPAALRWIDVPERLPARPGLQRLLTVVLEDVHGTCLLRNGEEVTFAVEGPATVAATDNGDASCPLPFQTDHAPLFRGTAGMLLRLTGKPGTVRLRAVTASGVAGEAVLRVG